MGWTAHDPHAGGDRRSGIDWAVNRVPAHTLDPYLFWAEASRRADLQGTGPDWLPAAFELHNRADAKAVAEWLATAEGCGRLQVAPVWQAALQDGRTRFFTGRLCLAGLGAWDRLEWFHSVRFGFVGGGFHPARVNPGALQRRSALQPGGTVIGVIDFGCCFAHERFSRADGDRWRTRVRALWDQGAVPPKDSALWSACADFGYGRETDGHRLDDLIAAACAEEGHDPAGGRIGARAVERRCYARADLLAMVPGDDPAPHGTQVMDVAAGRGFAYPGTTPAADDRAAQAELLFVQLPEAAVQDLSGGWLAVYVIDALRWLVDRAEGRPLVVNLSLGSFAGSHDGESLLERALEAVAASGVEVVLAAGNIEGLGVHLAAELAPGGEVRFDLLLPDGDGTQSFLELWYRSADKALPAVTLTPAMGGPPVTLGAAGAALMHLPSAPAERPVAALLHAPGTRSGGGDGLVLLATAPTMTPGRDVPGWPVRAPHGRWRVQVHNPGKTPLSLHAWVERDDPGIVPLWLAPQPRLEAVAGCTLSDDHTLSGQCGGPHVRVVSAYRLNSGERSLDNARGPGRPPGRRTQVDHQAPGSQALDARDAGLPVAAGYSGQSVFSKGTSLAAPWVVRALVNAGGAALPRDGRRLPPVVQVNTPPAAA